MHRVNLTAQEYMAFQIVSQLYYLSLLDALTKASAESFRICDGLDRICYGCKD